MNSNTEHFNILGLENNASFREIKKAYSSARKVWIVDESAPEKLKNRSKIQLHRIDEAYNILLNDFIGNIYKVKNILKKLATDKYTQSSSISDLKMNSTDKEYSIFKIKTKEVEFSNLKIRYWWRALYLALILTFLNILYFCYPIDTTIQEQQPIQIQQTNEPAPKVQSSNIKEEKNNIKDSQNNKQTNNEIKAQVTTQTKQEHLQENKKDTTSIKHPSQNTTTKEKQIVNKTENKANTANHNKKQETNTTNNGKKSEYHLTKQNVPVLIPVKEVPTISPNNNTNTNNKTKTKTPTSRSDFNAVSDYFE